LAINLKKEERNETLRVFPFRDLRERNEIIKRTKREMKLFARNEIRGETIVSLLKLGFKKGAN
jgi:hypothetical protein